MSERAPRGVEPLRPGVHLVDLRERVAERLLARTGKARQDCAGPARLEPAVLLLHHGPTSYAGGQVFVDGTHNMCGSKIRTRWLPNWSRVNTFLAWNAVTGLMP